MSLTVLTVLLALSANLQSVTDDWNRGLGLVVFLSEDSGPDALEDLGRRVAQWEEVQSVEAFSKQDAFEDLSRSLGEDIALLEGLDPSLLPASLQVVLKPEYRGESGRESVGLRILSLGSALEVERVDYGQDMVDRTEGLRELVRLGGWAVGALVLVAVIFIITNTVRLTLFARKEEIEVMQLVGATNSFIRVPFYIEGAFQGGVGAIAAIGLSRLMLSSIPVDAMVGEMSSMLPEFHFLSTSTILILVCSSASMGVVASHLATGRFLRDTGE